MEQETENKYRAVLARTTTDRIKSKVQSPDVVELVLDVYMTPDDYADVIKKYYEREFAITIS